MRDDYFSSETAQSTTGDYQTSLTTIPFSDTLPKLEAEANELEILLLEFFFFSSSSLAAAAKAASILSCFSWCVSTYS